MSSPVWDQNHQVDYLRLGHVFKKTQPISIQTEALWKKGIEEIHWSICCQMANQVLKYLITSVANCNRLNTGATSVGLADPFKSSSDKRNAFVESCPSSYLSWLHDSNSFFHLIRAPRHRWQTEETHIKLWMLTARLLYFSKEPVQEIRSRHIQW